MIEKELKETNIPLYEYYIPKDEGDGVVLKKELYIQRAFRVSFSSLSKRFSLSTRA